MKIVRTTHDTINFCHNLSDKLFGMLSGGFRFKMSFSWIILLTSNIASLELHATFMYPPHIHLQLQLLENTHHMFSLQLYATLQNNGILTFYILDQISLISLELHTTSMYFNLCLKSKLLLRASRDLHYTTQLVLTTDEDIKRIIVYMILWTWQCIKKANM